MGPGTETQHLRHGRRAGGDDRAAGPVGRVDDWRLRDTGGVVMLANVVYEYNGQDSSIMFIEEEESKGVIVFAEDSDEQVTRTPLPASELLILVNALSPSHAALVAQVERLEAALDVADDVHAWLELMLPDMSQEDRDYLHPLHIAFRVLSGDAVQPGDLGEGGAA